MLRLRSILTQRWPIPGKTLTDCFKLHTNPVNLPFSPVQSALGLLSPSQLHEQLVSLLAPKKIFWALQEPFFVRGSRTLEVTMFRRSSYHARSVYRLVITTWMVGCIGEQA